MSIRNNSFSWSQTLTTGFAMFSMFFGAGNVVFPLGIGQFAESQNLYSILAFLITAVGVPFLGLMSMTLYDGNYKTFFARIGPRTGFITALLIMGLIGPFGAIPRCIALSFKTTQIFLPDLSMTLFSIVSCLIIFLFTVRQNNIVDLLGKILTPLLLLALGIIIVKGILISPELNLSPLNSTDTFLHGLKEGYQTMDLLGAFFFSSVIIVCLKKERAGTEQEQHRSMLKETLAASLVGAILLSLIYVGFSFVSAFNSQLFSDVPKDELLGKMAIHILGPYGGLIACSAVALACLTTAIALSAVSAEFIHKDISNNKVPYWMALIFTLIVSFFVSTLNFTGIVKILAPILEIFYPALILLSILNILYKIYRVESVKLPVFALFAASLLGFVVSIWL